MTIDHKIDATSKGGSFLYVSPGQIPRHFSSHSRHYSCALLAYARGWSRLHRISIFNFGAVPHPFSHLEGHNVPTGSYLLGLLG